MGSLHWEKHPLEIHGVGAGRGEQRVAMADTILIWPPWPSHTVLPLWLWLVAQLEKNPLAIQETPVLFLGREDPLEKG